MKAAPAPVFAFRRSNRRNTFRVSLQSKEVGKTAPYGIRIAKRQQVSQKTLLARVGASAAKLVVVAPSGAWI